MTGGTAWPWQIGQPKWSCGAPGSEGSGRGSAVPSAVRIVHRTNGQAAAADPGIVRSASGIATKSCKSMAAATTKAAIGRATSPAIHAVRPGNIGVCDIPGGNTLMTKRPCSAAAFVATRG
jgi:hypothetical protein